MDTVEKQQKIKDVRRRAEIKAREFSDVFETEAGKRVMEEIRGEFCSFVVTDNPHTTIINAAQRDVVVWLEKLIERGKDYDLEG